MGIVVNNLCKKFYNIPDTAMTEIGLYPCLFRQYSAEYLGAVLHSESGCGSLPCHEKTHQRSC